MQDFITHDFGLDKYAEYGQQRVYGRLKEDVWHFIQIRDEGQVSHMIQRHVPRYLMARAFDSLSGKIPPNGDSVVMTVDSKRAGIALMPDGRIAIVTGQSMQPIPEAVGRSFGQDVGLLKKAGEEVRKINDHFSLPNELTFSGNPVNHLSKDLIEAIAFEKLQRGYLNAREFGIYSAYCTWRDFISENPDMVDEISSGMANDLTNWNAEEIGNENYWSSVFSIQDRLFPQRIWGPGVITDYDTVYTRMYDILSKLSSIGFAQFNLFCGMQSGGPFHPLALLTGEMGLDEFNYWRSLEFQADSPEEQDIRVENAFIQLLGTLG